MFITLSVSFLISLQDNMSIPLKSRIRVASRALICDWVQNSQFEYGCILGGGRRHLFGDAGFQRNTHTPQRSSHRSPAWLRRRLARGLQLSELSKAWSFQYIDETTVRLSIVKICQRSQTLAKLAKCWQNVAHLRLAVSAPIFTCIS